MRMHSRIALWLAIVLGLWIGPPQAPVTTAAQETGCCVCWTGCTDGLTNYDCANSCLKDLVGLYEGQSCSSLAMCQTGCCFYVNGTCGQTSPSTCADAMAKGLAITFSPGVTCPADCSSGCCHYDDGTCHPSGSAACWNEFWGAAVSWSPGPCPSPPQCIPEPGTVVLAAGGLGLVGMYLKRRRSRR